MKPNHSRTATLPFLFGGLAELLVVAAGYYGAARLGLLLAFAETNSSPVWPPSGIALAAVFLRGYRVGPGIWLGAFLANVVVFTANQVAGAVVIVVVSACIALGNTLEAITGTFLLRRLTGIGNPLDRSRDVFLFVLTALLMCLTSCTIGSTSLCWSGIATWGLYRTIWFTWWLGDVAGVLVVAPLFLAWWQGPVLPRLSWTLIEAALFLAFLLVTGQIVFGSWLPTQGVPNALAFTLIPFLVWAAFRFGQRGLVLATVLVSGVAIWGTVQGFGPFVRDGLNESMRLLQAFIGIATVTGLVLTAVLTERQRSEAALQQAHAELKRHAAQLQSANTELEAFAYSVSHDLRAPLRSIEGFSQILVEDYTARLDEEGRDALQRVQGAARHMSQLIDDLLNLSRLSRSELRPVASGHRRGARGARGRDSPGPPAGRGRGPPAQCQPGSPRLRAHGPAGSRQPRTQSRDPGTQASRGGLARE